MHFRSLAVFALVGTLTELVSAHAKISSATGNAGGKGAGLGITPNSGNSQSDVGIISGNTGCGKTVSGGTINIGSATQTDITNNGGTLPQVSSGGSLSMTLHQVNADGAGPYTCSINTDGTGNSFTAITVTTNVPGTGGKSTASNQDFPLNAALPANMQCTGTVAGQSNVCIVACKNPSGFGGCVPVQQTGGTNTGTNTGTNNGGAAAVSVPTTLQTSTTPKAAKAPATSATSTAAAAVASTTGTTTSTTTGHGHHHHHQQSNNTGGTAAAGAAC